LDAAGIAAALKEAGVNGGDVVVAGLLDEARQHAERVLLETEKRSQLDAANVPVVSLPYVNDGIDVGALYDLAEELRRSGELWR
jgi:hypothetical protein